MSKQTNAAGGGRGFPNDRACGMIQDMSVWTKWHFPALALLALALASPAADNPPVIHPKCVVTETNYCTAYTEIALDVDAPCCVGVSDTNVFPVHV